MGKNKGKSSKKSKKSSSSSSSSSPKGKGTKKKITAPETTTTAPAPEPEVGIKNEEADKIPDEEDEVGDVIMSDDDDEENEEEAEIDESKEKEKDDDAMDVADAAKDEKKKKEASNDDGNKPKPKPKPAMPFLDAFYSLSSDAPRERNVAAHCILTHLFPSAGEGNDGDNDDGDNDVPLQDASYALGRLMDGLCSGRAGARQGYGGCLSGFLQLAMTTKLPEGTTVMGAIAAEQSDDADADAADDGGRSSPAAFVRAELLKRTTFSSPVTGKGGHKKKGGSEERDCKFGRLFGILSVVRSGTLRGDDVPQSVVDGYASDLVDLYRYKSWMRESASFGIAELIGSFFPPQQQKQQRRRSSKKQGKGKGKTVSAVGRRGLQAAENVVVPRLLLRRPDNSRIDGGGDDDDGASSAIEKILGQWTPEQIGLAIRIQSLSPSTSEPLPAPLDRPVLTPSNASSLAGALASTSSVVHPRVHSAWPSVWGYLSNGGQLRDDAEEIVGALMEEVVSKQLLGEKGTTTTTTATTHERRALALSLVQSMCGVPPGPGGTVPNLPPDVIENAILAPAVVDGLFFKVLITSGGKEKKGAGKAEHTLRPLALTVLNSVVDRAVQGDHDGDAATDESGEGSGENEEGAVGGSDVPLRLSLARSLLSCSPRFDSATRTDAVSSLLYGGPCADWTA
eukprot:CAMPEP_0113598672 /NCGR_PEP_ID=MMETSP0015_2-20120614/41722_1 /TAXON_ID=2838 /ORGANISM="Odontella" /LENGTH=679 /DNA_ID=CAMNT_0000506725 /DNA_START=164 /DNA_END=2201 /DNA_ORIENTATION=- /assembly_acc=CAM_ASM_000160